MRGLAMARGALRDGPHDGRHRPRFAFDRIAEDEGHDAQPPRGGGGRVERHFRRREHEVLMAREGLVRRAVRGNGTFELGEIAMP